MEVNPDIDAQITQKALEKKQELVEYQLCMIAKLILYRQGCFQLQSSP